MEKIVDVTPVAATLSRIEPHAVATKIFEVLSTATPTGAHGWGAARQIPSSAPQWIPGPAALVMIPVARDTFWTSLLPVSATYKSPFGPIAMESLRPPTPLPALLKSSEALSAGPPFPLEPVRPFPATVEMTPSVAETFRTRLPSSK
ncbi:MAG TPA: hypothetical protein VIX84_00935 [Acidimicrobiales bacterium]